MIQTFFHVPVPTLGIISYFRSLDSYYLAVTSEEYKAIIDGTIKVTTRKLD